jgi:hypothetical protein
MSVTNTVVLTTSAGVAPLSRSSRSALAKAWVSWAGAPPSTSVAGEARPSVPGRRPSWPEQISQGPALTMGA